MGRQLSGAAAKQERHLIEQIRYINIITVGEVMLQLGGELRPGEGNLPCTTYLQGSGNA